jgi:hypothetical protein
MGWAGQGRGGEGWGGEGLDGIVRSSWCRSHPRTTATCSCGTRRLPTVRITRRRNSHGMRAAHRPNRVARAPPPAIACTRLTGAALQAHLHSRLAASPLAASLSCVRAAKAPFKRLTSGTGVGGHNRPVFGLCFVQPRAAAAAAEGIADLADEAHNWRLVSCSMDRSVIGCAVTASVRRSQSAYSAYSCPFAAAGGWAAVVVRCPCLVAQTPLAPPCERRCMAIGPRLHLSRQFAHSPPSRCPQRCRHCRPPTPILGHCTALHCATFTSVMSCLAAGRPSGNGHRSLVGAAASLQLVHGKTHQPVDDPLTRRLRVRSPSRPVEPECGERSLALPRPPPRRAHPIGLSLRRCEGTQSSSRRPTAVGSQSASAIRRGRAEPPPPARPHVACRARPHVACRARPHVACNAWVRRRAG